MEEFQLGEVLQKLSQDIREKKEMNYFEAKEFILAVSQTLKSQSKIIRIKNIGAQKECFMCLNSNPEELVESGCPGFHIYCKNDLKEKVRSDTKGTLLLDKYLYLIKCPCNQQIQPQQIYEAYGGENQYNQSLTLAQECFICREKFQKLDQIQQMECKKCYYCNQCLKQKVYEDTKDLLQHQDYENIKCSCSKQINIKIVYNAFGNEKQFIFEQYRAQEKILKDIGIFDPDKQKFTCPLCYEEKDINEAYQCASQECK